MELKKKIFSPNAIRLLEKLIIVFSRVNDFICEFTITQQTAEGHNSQ